MKKLLKISALIVVVLLIGACLVLPAPDEQDGEMKNEFVQEIEYNGELSDDNGALTESPPEVTNEPTVEEVEKEQEEYEVLEKLEPNVPSEPTTANEEPANDEYQFYPVDDGAWQASNPKNDMEILVQAAGVEVTAQAEVLSDWKLGLSLTAIGREGTMVTVEPAEPEVEANYVEFARAALTEWYRNDERGLKQGFTIENPPESDDSNSPLCIEMALTGDLMGRIFEDNKVVSFTTQEGIQVFEYNELVVWDSNNVELPAYLYLGEDSLTIIIDDSAAVYPVIVDPCIGTENIMWLNHFDLLPGAPELTTTYRSTSSGVGGGLTGLVIQSSTLGDTFSTGGNKVVHMAIDVPLGFNITGVRVGYEFTGNMSYITQIRLAQVQDPPSTALVLMDDGTDHTNPGPIYVDSQNTKIDPSKGALLLSLRLYYGNTADKICIRALGLKLVPAASATNIMWVNHFDLLPGAPELTTTYRSTSSGVGGGLTGLVIQSTTLGDTFNDSGNKVVHMAVDVPVGYNVTGVRVGYEFTGNMSYITQIRLAQVQKPPSTALVILDDGTNQINPGPIYVNSASTNIDPTKGALLLSLRLYFGNTADKICIRALGLQLQPASTAYDVVWLNHFDLLPGAPELTTTYRSTSSGVGGGLTGLVIQSSTLGDTFSTGGNKVVHMAIDVPVGYLVTGVCVAYEYTSNTSYITQIRLAQVQDPPSTALVLHDDGTDQMNLGPIYAKSHSAMINPSNGSLLLSLRLYFGNTADKIVIRALGLCVMNIGEPILKLLSLIDYIESLDPSAFSNPNHGKTLVNKLEAVIKQICNGEFNGAINKITHDLLPKTDGEHPPPDWVIDPTAQQYIEDRLNEILAALQGIGSPDCGC